MKFVVNSVQTRNLTLHTIRHALVVLRMFQYHFFVFFFCKPIPQAPSDIFNARNHLSFKVIQ